MSNFSVSFILGQAVIHRIWVNCGQKIKSSEFLRFSREKNAYLFVAFHNWCCTVHDSHETRCDDDDVDGRGVGRRRRSRAVAELRAAFSLWPKISGPAHAPLDRVEQ